MNENDKKIFETELNRIIFACLNGPPSDPEVEHLKSSAIAYKLLKHFDLFVQDEDLVKIILSGENLHLYNYLNNE